MNENDKIPIESLTDLPITLDPVGYQRNELVNCPKCERTNGPERPTYLYCGESLPITERNATGQKVSVRELESWEPGINVVLLSANEEADVEAGSEIGIDAERLREFLQLGTPVPIARVESNDIAGKIIDLLANNGLSAVSLDDRDINAEHPPLRLRSAKIEDGRYRFTDFNTDEQTIAEFDELVLMVKGRIFENMRAEVTKRKKRQTKVLEETETGKDSQILDLYTASDSRGFRILTTGFDFSILEKEKGLIADENIEKLAALFARLSPNAILADEYEKVHSRLDGVWEVETRKDVEGLQIRGYAKREFGARYTASNLQQFTKYSRMRRLLL